jgi:hypothetical protein
VSFPSKPELEVIHDLKNACFKWSGRQKIWHAKEYPYRVELLNILATYGGEIGEEKSFAEIMEAKVERSKDRAERHREYADNAAKKADFFLQTLAYFRLGYGINAGYVLLPIPACCGVSRKPRHLPNCFKWVPVIRQLSTRDLTSVSRIFDPDLLHS